MNDLDDMCLRPWAPGDVSNVLQAFAGEGMEPQGADDVRTIDDARRWIRAHPWEPEGRSASLAIDMGGRAVGNVSLTNIGRRHSTAWVSYWVDEEYRGRGLATRATATIAGVAFRDLGLFRLELGHRRNNPESGRVALAAGFTIEGTQRAKLQYGEARFDVDIYARLATDDAPTCDLLDVRLPRSTS